ncbi:hypothetical protein EVAR_13081_1 [Eumeta japonica]|uniref:Uncharacterized protein n=1 Tax=Eumeta variegata TaxID=151549 RepID=A0A4C1U9K6_EUMVA|nr:hypothetical protein EVAR_13081_1 [Eumeta japonica]
MLVIKPRKLSRVLPKECVKTDLCVKHIPHVRMTEGWRAERHKARTRTPPPARATLCRSARPAGAATALHNADSVQRFHGGHRRGPFTATRASSHLTSPRPPRSGRRTSRFITTIAETSARTRAAARWLRSHIALSTPAATPGAAGPSFVKITTAQLLTIRVTVIV